MRLIGLLIFYDESPTWLSTCVASLARFCDHVVAVDGAFALYPNAAPHSGPDAAAEIISTALALGVGVSYHAPQTLWYGNEVEKRNALLDIGTAVATPEEDWFVIVDADEIVTYIPGDLRETLASTDAAAATYQLYERTDWHGDTALEDIARAGDIPSGWTPIRGLLRAQETLHLHGDHSSYSTRDENDDPILIGAAIDTDLRVEHRQAFRTRSRLRAAAEYDELRDRLGVEAGKLPSPV